VLETFGKSKRQKYEVEIERIDTRLSLSNLLNCIHEIYKIAQGVPEEFLLNSQQIEKIKEKWNYLIPAALGLHNNMFFHEYISRAKDITLEDFANPQYVNN
jgi:hypothetical protein